MQLLNTLVGELQSKIGDKARIVVDEDIIRNSFLFVASSLAGLHRIKYVNEGTPNYINYFGITFARSGGGKDISLLAAEHMFWEAIKNYPATTHSRFIQLNGPTPQGDVANDDVNFIVPKQYKLALRGSVEGMMRVANYYDRVDLGTLNVISTEFGSEFNQETMVLLMQLWQSARADGSVNVNEKYDPVSDVPTNILLFGSPVPFKSNIKKHESLVEIIHSGFARRTFFVWNETSGEKLWEGEYDPQLLNEYAENFNSYISNKKLISFDNDAKLALEEYLKESFESYAQNRSIINEMRKNGIEKVERLAALLGIIDLSDEVTPEHVKKAIEINEESLSSIRDVIAPGSAYKRIYDELKRNRDGLTISEIHDCGIWFRNKTEEKYQFELLEDYVFRKNERIVLEGKTYRIEPLPVNKLDKIVVSVSMQERNPERAVDFVPMELPFFDEHNAIEKLVVSEKVTAFTLAHYEPSKQAPNGHRKADNFIPGQNCIAWDIDQGMTVEEAVQRLNGYVFLLYTTKSHTEEHHKFRILMPTKTMFYVNPEQHKQMYENLSQVLGLPTYDVSTRNVSRLWFTNPGGMVLANKEAELLDVRCCIPTTERAEQVLPKLEDVDFDKLDIRVQGMLRWLLTNTTEGSRNMNLFRYGAFLRDLGFSSSEIESMLLEANAMLVPPLDDREVAQIARKF